MESSGSGSEPARVEGDPHSSFRLEITLAIGYRRRRAFGTTWEGPVVSLGLLIGGIAVVLWFLWTITQIVSR